MATSQRWTNGSTAAWRAVRALVLERDEYRCQIKLPGEWVTRDGHKRRCLGRATQAHHTRAREVVGDDPRYLVAACAPCNRKTGDPTAGDPQHRSMTQW
jgi:5-methylcytosine-specific restriction endonuclease McrA